MAISTSDYEMEDNTMINESLRAIQDTIPELLEVLSSLPYQIIKDSLSIIDKRGIGEQIRDDIYLILLKEDKPTSLKYLYDALRGKYGKCVGNFYNETIREYLQMDVFDKKLLEKDEYPCDKVFDHMTKNACYQPKWFRLKKGVYEIIRPHEKDLLKITSTKDITRTLLFIDYDGKRKVYSKKTSNVVTLIDTF